MKAAAATIILLALSGADTRAGALGRAPQSGLSLEIVGGEIVTPRPAAGAREAEPSLEDLPELDPLRLDTFDRGSADTARGLPQNGLVALRGSASAPPVVVDATVAPLLDAVLMEARARGIRVTVTSAFRTTGRQAALYANRASNPHPVSPPGASLHEAGFAVDVARSAHAEAEWATLVDIFSRYGARWAGPDDPVHFQWDPVALGFPSPHAAIAANQNHYTRLIRGGASAKDRR